MKRITILFIVNCAIVLAACGTNFAQNQPAAVTTPTPDAASFTLNTDNDVKLGFELGIGENHKAQGDKSIRDAQAAAIQQQADAQAQAAKIAQADEEKRLAGSIQARIQAKIVEAQEEAERQKNKTKSDKTMNDGIATGVSIGTIGGALAFVVALAVLMIVVLMYFTNHPQAVKTEQGTVIVVEPSLAGRIQGEGRLEFPDANVTGAVAQIGAAAAKKSNDPAELLIQASRFVLALAPGKKNVDQGGSDVK